MTCHDNDVNIKMKPFPVPLDKYTTGTLKGAHYGIVSKQQNPHWCPMKKVTIHDVAELAGVSIKTVSRVVNNESAVRENTKIKVSEAIKALNYKPNLSARNLRGTQTFIFGLLYDNANAYYVVDMQNGLLSECLEKNYELLIRPCDSHAPDIVKQVSDLIHHSRLAGLILTPPLADNPEILDHLKEIELPYVRITSGKAIPGKCEDGIFVDDEAASMHITDHLISLGHKRIAYITGDMTHESSPNRLNGHLAALKKAGVPSDPALIIHKDYSFESGVEGFKELLTLDELPTAAVGGNDEVAAGILYCARLNDISVPSDLAIAGFENSPFSRQTWPKLTTASQPNTEIARRAAQLLIKLCRPDRSPEHDASQHCFIPELIVRGSTTADN